MLNKIVFAACLALMYMGLAHADDQGTEKQASKYVGPTNYRWEVIMREKAQSSTPLAASTNELVSAFENSKNYDKAIVIYGFSRHNTHGKPNNNHEVNPGGGFIYYFGKDKFICGRLGITIGYMAVNSKNGSTDMFGVECIRAIYRSEVTVSIGVDIEKIIYFYPRHGTLNVIAPITFIDFGIEAHHMRAAFITRDILLFMYVYEFR